MIVPNTRTFNVTLTMYGVNSANNSIFTKRANGSYVGNYSGNGIPLLSIDSAWYWNFNFSKGQIYSFPIANLSDVEQNSILNNILTTLQNQNNQNVVTAINNQTVQQQTIANQQEQAAEQRQEEIMNDDTSQAETQMADFMTNFDAGEDQTLSSVITAPIRLAAALQGLTCTPLQLPLPIVNTNLVLPCPRQKLQQAFPQIILLWDGITTGLIAYGLAVHLFQIMQKAKNPDDVGKVEIFEL